MSVKVLFFKLDEITGGVLEEGEGFWTLFIQLTSKLKCLKLLQFFADHAVAEVAHRKVSGVDSHDMDLK